MLGNYRPFHWGIVALLSLLWAPWNIARADLIQGINDTRSPAFAIWDPSVESIGWYFEPTEHFYLTEILTTFRTNTGRSEDVDRLVTIELLSDRRSEGGELLASGTFDSATARGAFGGAVLDEIIELVPGTTYFVGFRNVNGLGVNFAGTSNPSNLIDPLATYTYDVFGSNNAGPGQYGIDFGNAAGEENPLRGPMLQFYGTLVPEPASIALFAGGLGVVALARFRARRRRSADCGDIQHV